LQGALIPEFHLNYWMGLKSGGQWPNFTWTDPFAKGPGAGDYIHWGKGGGEVPEEPNNFEAPPENCELAPAPGPRRALLLALAPKPAQPGCSGCALLAAERRSAAVWSMA
jgi:hypothetical protein